MYPFSTAPSTISSPRSVRAKTVDHPSSEPTDPTEMSASSAV